MNLVKSTLIPLLELITLILEKSTDYEYTVNELEYYSLSNEDFDERIFLLMCAQNKMILPEEFDKYKNAEFNGYSAYSFIINNEANLNDKLVQLDQLNHELTEKDQRIFSKFIKWIDEKDSYR